MIRKKKIFQDESIKALALRIVPPLSAFRIRRKKKKSIVLPFIVSRTITDRQETEVDSREKKKNLGIFLARFEEVARSERSNGVEREGILIWISSAAVTDHLPFHRRKFLPPLSSSSSPPLPCSRRPTRGSTKPLRIDLPLLLLRVIPLRS